MPTTGEKFLTDLYVDDLQGAPNFSELKTGEEYILKLFWTGIMVKIVSVSSTERWIQWNTHHWRSITYGKSITTN